MLSKRILEAQHHFFGVLLVTIGLVGVQACDASPRFNGLSPREAFADPRVAALADAVCDAKMSEAERLLSEGVPANARGVKGTTPLFWAVACDNQQGVKILLEHGADPNLAADSDFSATWLAAERGRIDVLGPILNSGGDPNARNRRGETALMKAAESGNADVLSALLKAGADVNALQDPSTPSPLTAPMYAVTVGHFDLALKLLQSGYSFDLEGFAWWVAARVAGDGQVRDKTKLLDALMAQGVTIPSEAELKQGMGRLKGNSDSPAR